MCSIVDEAARKQLAGLLAGVSLPAAAASCHALMNLPYQPKYTQQDEMVLCGVSDACVGSILLQVAVAAIANSDAELPLFEGRLSGEGYLGASQPVPIFTESIKWL